MRHESIDGIHVHFDTALHQRLDLGSVVLHLGMVDYHSNSHIESSRSRENLSSAYAQRERAHANTEGVPCK